MSQHAQLETGISNLIRIGFQEFFTIPIIKCVVPVYNQSLWKTGARVYVYICTLLIKPQLTAQET